MSLFLYNFFLVLYSAGIRIASLWNRKARLWIHGRKNFPQFNESGTVIWMHCASLGEFEQGRPLIEKIRKDHPSFKIVVTFFSPSGYENRKSYPGADAIFYLPMDNASNASEFVDIIRPTLVLWIKYEYWYYYLSELKKRNIPVLLISGIFRESQPFFRWYGKIWREMLESFSHLFLQDKRSEQLVTSLAGTKISISGDTRFDRVTDIAEKSSNLSEIMQFCDNKKIVVAGSTWLEDETQLMHYAKLHPEIRFIIAPHEVDKENLAEVKNEFRNSIFYSQLLTISELSPKTNVLIIDNIGMLSKLYRYATVSYVGGGFNASGIHNVLEAAVYGKPVIFGPVYEKFAEARGLVECGGGFSINNAPQLEALLNSFLNDEEKLIRSGNAARDFVYKNRGATEMIIRYIAEKRLLIS